MPPLADAPKRPNIIFLLTDDQDKHLGSLEYMPFVKKHLIDKGTVFENHFVTSAICCPSRVSVLKGQFAHNTGFTDVFGQFGGYDKFLREGMDNEYLATWLQSAGYSTYYIGKLLNGYGVHNKEQYPKGWTDFDALVHPYVYDNFHPVFAKNGIITDYEGTFQVDVVREKALQVLSGALKTVDEKPFFLYLAPTAPHTEILFNSDDVAQVPGEKPYSRRIKKTEAIPAKRHATLFPDAKVPRRENFNTADVTGKPRYITELPLLNDEQVETLDHWHRQRLRALQSVDELLDSVVQAVEAAGQGDNTYIFYSSDNGYHLGLHRLNAGKMTPYEDDINVPFIVRGPGVAKGAVRKESTTHTDIAPTFLKLAGAENKAYAFDGSPIPIFTQDAPQPNRESFAVEFWRPLGSEVFPIAHSEENIYRSVRIVSEEYSYLYTVWCTDHHELYDLKKDPQQLKNVYKSSSIALVNRLDALLVVLKDCVGKECQSPWTKLHPDGSVKRFGQALDAKYDAVYQKTERLVISECLNGFYPENEKLAPALLAHEE
ncbi:Arylsulphatase [Rhizoclosmatium globosum]|uniref:Arylsulphatase n=1 Tax=Rhizoclosmatium globosum TaxID=329046 RepID=A0A1Y2BX77_9FUNG|nr:Arylsulphatase [Rhizoclosmatium globosum]|eukprot:ORY39353.1 Arylsulphatase [Rhizoclosmatium globosum]